MVPLFLLLLRLFIVLLLLLPLPLLPLLLLLFVPLPPHLLYPSHRSVGFEYSSTDAETRDYFIKVPPLCHCHWLRP
jgi:hypothetical protein